MVAISRLNLCSPKILMVYVIVLFSFESSEILHFYVAGVKFIQDTGHHDINWRVSAERLVQFPLSEFHLAQLHRHIIMRWIMKFIFQAKTWFFSHKYDHVFHLLRTLETHDIEEGNFTEMHLRWVTSDFDINIHVPVDFSTRIGNIMCSHSSSSPKSYTIPTSHFHFWITVHPLKSTYETSVEFQLSF